MNDIVWKAITFTGNGDTKNGYYFYNMTLAEAIKKVNEKGIDPIRNVRINIAVYPW